MQELLFVKFNIVKIAFKKIIESPQEQLKNKCSTVPSSTLQNEHNFVSLI
jgi:hypothetical protein